jgi:hypothetical protein
MAAWLIDSSGRLVAYGFSGELYGLDKDVTNNFSMSTAILDLDQA